MKCWFRNTCTCPGGGCREPGTQSGQQLDCRLLGTGDSLALVLDSTLGDHLHGIDLGIRAREQGRKVFVIHNPCLNNSQFLNRVPAGFSESKDALLGKWPDAGRYLR